MKDRNQTAISAGLIKADIIAAGQSINYFKKHGNKDIKNVAAYHMQQATEKLIKIQIYAQKSNTDNAKLYTLNINSLEKCYKVLKAWSKDVL